MAPNPRVAAAFRAMKDIGIKEDKVKPVLIKLLKLYEKNWELIEEENYRALADAIFEEEDTKVVEQKKKCNNTDEEDLEEEAQTHDEPERPLKRLRLRSQGGQVSPLVNSCSHNLDGSLSERPKMEEDELPKSHFQQRPQEIMETPQSIQQTISPQLSIVNKGKKPLLPCIDSLEKRSMSDRESHVVHIKEPMVESDIALLPKQKVPNTRVLIKPKDEPFDDMFNSDVPDYEVPIAVIHPDPCKVDSLVGHGSGEKQDGPEIPASQCLGEGNRGDCALAPSSERETNCTLATIPKEPPPIVEIASLPLGEEGSIKRIPTPDVLGRSSPKDALDMEDKEKILSLSLHSSNGSVHIQCSPAVAEHLSRLPQALNGLDGHIHASKKITKSSCVGSEPEKELEDPESRNSCSLAVVPQYQISPGDSMSIHDVNDVSKGEENVRIPWVNEINSELLPPFKYIPQNLVFQNAAVKLTLSRIGDEDCCLACLGDCLSLSTPCPCANETGRQFAYTQGGLLREKFLEECISMTHDPQRHQHLYCRECPLERLRNGDCLEPCKGHLRRKFIKECWNKCGCSKQCGNRVVQRGITCKLQVFCTSEGKGWGLRTLEELPKGAFVCEYAGEILTNTELYDRNLEKNKSGKPAYSVLLDADWGSGDLNNKEALCLDATFFGNVARFINHRCLDANLVEIPVKVESPDHAYYHLGFFTTRVVAAMEELTWDYGIDFEDHDQPVRTFWCRCGSKFCRNMKRSNRFRSASIA
ncbi:probable inactive histone-lysine N-methyltransferase SUVR2 [Juglans microcarpa x Juglans regia]|uniref:probable inactive histone-lysine N-methyltransferase SUVR2 n=1 Tax=Juglans microcarpa x Juglans regia TaxID=2249226 RepID=UPI001B7DD606|nr:probable inactive histone-lysine N-methyltransferase SUVR2 [Juglans microcarpa x Juglans regia]XP_041008499.1 probable inactive histone-lysine N-methyltransferase SUVR2 [Juglans microcarpa x Juglans regia]XP_041008500.1 probable inactive histone-lysine N-methyltransferase SUVR2 [Juglans microcarpa x Juglans regia]XP_041008501.1 probable inactive histone-lysine N-methyltransferase SUVR2 [Juglans microcarpa x Juglans regia]XP_041008502.1 probable inactive histone-lysine N-methyltransferase SUV